MDTLFQPFIDHFSVNQVSPQLNASAAAALAADPSSDNYQYFRGNVFSGSTSSILKRYEKYNGTEGNSKTQEQSLAETGIENSASTPLPDAEDVNRDNNTSKADEYFEYKVSIRPQDLQQVGNNFISDIVSTSVKLANGKQETVRWIQFKIPLAQFLTKVGNIQDFKSIRFVRSFIQDFFSLNYYFYLCNTLLR